MVNKIKDTYAQFMKLSTTMSAANTLTFADVAIGAALFEYAGIVIHRIEYYVGADAVALMTTAQDGILAAICGSDTITDLSTSRPEVYDKMDLYRDDFGTPANAVLRERPIIKDYSTMPGGGQLVPAKDFYLGVTSTGLASAVTISARLWYSFVQLKAEDYLEIAQRLRVLST